MSNEETPERATWAERLTDQIAETIASYRDQRGVSTQWLADECTRLGMPMTRTALAAVLTQKSRKSITVQELAVLGRALEIPPLMLLYPVGSGERTEVLPEVHVDALVAADWFAGRQEAPAMRPDKLTKPRPADLDVSKSYARYFELVVAFQFNNRALASEGHEAALHGETENDPPFVAASARAARRALGLMRKMRDEIGAAGKTVPALPPGLEDRRGWDQPATLPVVEAVDALPGERAKFPLVLVDQDGNSELGHG